MAVIGVEENASSADTVDSGLAKLSWSDKGGGIGGLSEMLRKCVGMALMDTDSVTDFLPDMRNSCSLERQNMSESLEEKHFVRCSVFLV